MPRTAPPGALALACATLALLLAAGCGGSPGGASTRASTRAAAPTTVPANPGGTPSRAGASAAVPRPGAVPPPLDPGDVYAADRVGMLSPAVRGDRSLVYVPNSKDNTVEEIDPATYRVVRRFAVGALPQHVVPSWDLRTLWVANDEGNTVTAVDPRTGAPGRTLPVEDPYNMYFTPDGMRAIVVAERLARLDFRDPQSMALRRSVAVPCRGVDHMDFSADGSHALVSCEFSGRMLWVDVPHERVAATLDLAQGGSMPQDVKLSPDGRVFYVADMMRGGVYVVDARRPRVVGFVATGAGAHGLYPSRDSRWLYVSNRSGGSISVISFASRRVARTWTLPGGGSPDMGGVSADGRVLWLSGRYNAEVYAIDTRSGRLIRRIPVGQGPHGLSVFPQPGRYSLGHTGVLR